MSKIDYVLDEESGCFFRYDEQGQQTMIGRNYAVEGGLVFQFEPGLARTYRSIVGREMAKRGIEISEYTEAEDITPGPAPEQADPAGTDGDGPHEVSDSEPGTDLDPEPPMDPEHGDKTPAFVEWLHRNNPIEFNRRYGVIEILPDGRIVARRKTVMTVKPEEVQR